MQTPHRPADSTKAKQMTRTITQEFTVVAKYHTIPRHINPTKDLKEYEESILEKETEENLDFRYLVKHPKHNDTWSHLYGNQIGRLAQGMPVQVNGTNTIFFITKTDVP